MRQLDARMSIELTAKQKGISTEECIKEIELAIDEAMKSDDPLVQARWKLIPRKGEKPTAEEFVDYVAKQVYNKRMQR